MSARRIHPRDAAHRVSEAISTIAMIDGALNTGADHANYKGLIESAFKSAQETLDAFWASLCDDEKDPDIFDAEICMLARLRENEAANAPPEEPDGLAKAIMRRAGALL